MSGERVSPLADLAQGDIVPLRAGTGQDLCALAGDPVLISI